MIPPFCVLAYDEFVHKPWENFHLGAEHLGRGRRHRDVGQGQQHGREVSDHRANRIRLRHGLQLPAQRVRRTLARLHQHRAVPGLRAHRVPVPNPAGRGELLRSPSDLREGPVRGSGQSAERLAAGSPFAIADAVLRPRASHRAGAGRQSMAGGDGRLGELVAWIPRRVQPISLSGCRRRSALVPSAARSGLRRLAQSTRSTLSRGLGSRRCSTGSACSVPWRSLAGTSNGLSWWRRTSLIRTRHSYCSERGDENGPVSDTFHS